MATEKRLIDANELEDKFRETKMIEIFPYWKELDFDTQCELVRFGKALKKMMQNAPTVDAVEVVHGRWETIEVTGDWEDVETYHHFHRECKYSYCDNGLSGHYYCPNCGAKMDGDGNG